MGPCLLPSLPASSTCPLLLSSLVAPCLSAWTAACPSVLRAGGMGEVGGGLGRWDSSHSGPRSSLPLPRPIPVTPMGPSLPGNRSTRPYTIFELDQVRQQGRRYMQSPGQSFRGRPDRQVMWGGPAHRRDTSELAAALSRALEKQEAGPVITCPQSRGESRWDLTKGASHLSSSHPQTLRLAQQSWHGTGGGVEGRPVSLSERATRRMWRMSVGCGFMLLRAPAHLPAAFPPPEVQWKGWFSHCA